MQEYKVKLLHSTDVLDSREIAMQLLNSYEHHLVGQPVVLYYKDANNGKTNVLFAVGKRNHDNTLNGRHSGPEFYDIINVVNTNNYYPKSLHWIDLK